MTAPVVFDFDTTCFTTSTIASTPIVCATPTPSFSPKRKYQYDNDSTTTPGHIKRQRLSVKSNDELNLPTTPLYRNFGNGISLCNTTKTNRFSNIEEILHFLTDDTTPSLERQNTMCDDIVNELMVELSGKNELPELNNVLLDLNDVLQADFDFL